MGAYLYTYNLFSILLLPLSAVYWVLYRLHKLLYKIGILKVQKAGAPVIVVGNITVGGSGKTPLVAWLCTYLQENGYRPGIISRGYKGQNSESQLVNPDSDPDKSGDEPVLLAGRTGAPVYISASRVKAAEHLLAENQCNVLISDDGLQHYRLHRDIEIAVVDGWRRFGNGFLLPAGPLRESKKRLSSVDWVLCRGGQPEAGELPYNYVAASLCNLKTGKEYSAHHLHGEKVHAVAGIGNPDQFFNQLIGLGCVVERHSFPDHYRYLASDLNFSDNLPIIMTEKDAVKCKNLVNQASNDIWYLVIKAQLPESFGGDILEKLKGVTKHG